MPQRYSVRYVHRIAPSPRDIGATIKLEPSDLLTRKTLGRALRDRGTLLDYARVREYRIEADGSIVVFPTCPGLTTYWHCIKLGRLVDES